MFESVTKHDNKKYNFLISGSSRCHNRHGRNWQDNKNIVLVKKLCFNFLAILIELNSLKKKRIFTGRTMISFLSAFPTDFCEFTLSTQNRNLYQRVQATILSSGLSTISGIHLFYL